jgi:4-hydroxybenzoate polyprenyltransferase
LYPFFLFGLAIPTLICLLFPLAGVLYSNPVYAFKKKKYLALALIVSAIVFIFLLGFLVSGGKPDVPLYLLLVMSALYGIGLVPLKDISDVEGDSAGGAENWFSTTGSNARIFALSIVLFAAASMLGLASGSLLIGIIMLINLAYFILLASFFSFRGRPWKRFFKLFMRIQPFTVGIFWIWYAFSNGGFFN